MLTPADINKMRFGTTRLREGYDQDEVDDFLDQVADQLAVTQQALAQAEEQVKQLQKQASVRSENPTASVPVVSSLSPASSVEKIITMAQETADKHVADAKTQADGIVREAGTQAAKAVEEAKAAADGIKGQAVIEAQQIRAQGLADKQKALDDLEARTNQVTVAHNGIKAEGDKIRQAMEQALQAFKNGVGQ